MTLHEATLWGNNSFETGNHLNLAKFHPNANTMLEHWRGRGLREIQIHGIRASGLDDLAPRLVSFCMKRPVRLAANERKRPQASTRLGRESADWHLLR